MPAISSSPLAPSSTAALFTVYVQIIPSLQSRPRSNAWKPWINATSASAVAMLAATGRAPDGNPSTIRVTEFLADASTSS
jgi:hypothetical protein